MQSTKESHWDRDDTQDILRRVENGETMQQVSAAMEAKGAAVYRRLPGDRPATTAQLNYLRGLGCVGSELRGQTVHSASRLIESKLRELDVITAEDVSREVEEGKTRLAETTGNRWRK